MVKIHKIKTDDEDVYELWINGVYCGERFTRADCYDLAREILREAFN